MRCCGLFIIFTRISFGTVLAYAPGPARSTFLTPHSSKILLSSSGMKRYVIGQGVPPRLYSSISASPLPARPLHQTSLQRRLSKEKSTQQLFFTTKTPLYPAVT